MQIFSSFITGFCVSCVLIGALYMLCPSGSMANSVKYVFCLCFVCCVLGVAIAMPKINFSYFEMRENKEILTEENTVFYAKEVFSEALFKQNINFRKIDVFTNKNKDGGIIIDRVVVYSNDDETEIKQTIDSEHYEVVVINE